MACPPLLTRTRQFVQALSNPYYLHHLCVQKHFEDDAFVEWCKYLTYFAEPKYLPYLSYVCPLNTAPPSLLFSCGEA